MRKDTCPLKQVAISVIKLKQGVKHRLSPGIKCVYVVNSSVQCIQFTISALYSTSKKEFSKITSRYY